MARQALIPIVAMLAMAAAEPSPAYSQTTNLRGSAPASDTTEEQKSKDDIVDESLMECEGARICRGEWVLANGARECRGGFYCSSGAAECQGVRVCRGAWVVVGGVRECHGGFACGAAKLEGSAAGGAGHEDGGDAVEELASQSTNASYTGSEDAKEAEEFEAELRRWQGQQKQEQSTGGEALEAQAADPAITLNVSTQSLYVCHGKKLCRGTWQFYGRRRVCKGGFVCCLGCLRG